MLYLLLPVVARQAIKYKVFLSTRHPIFYQTYKKKCIKHIIY